MRTGVVGEYVIQRLLGQGGVGAVYLAEHTLLGRTAALKVLHPSLSSDPDIVERFFDEARATASICDPGIVQVFDVGYDGDGGAFIVMEYLDGPTLDERLEARGPLPYPEALRLIQQLATTLQSVHHLGVIHRDLKLENVLLVPDQAIHGGERAKILDFGICKLTRRAGDRSHTRTGAVMGTPIYMSPEQCRDSHEVDARSDLYSLGCMLFCLLTGRPPFDYYSHGELMAAHLTEDPPRVSTVIDGVPPEIDALLARCLAKRPEDRFPSMASLALAITNALAARDQVTTLDGLVNADEIVGGSWKQPTTLSSVAIGHELSSGPTVRDRRRLRASRAALRLMFSIVLLAMVGYMLGTFWTAGQPRTRAAAQRAAPPIVDAAPAPASGTDRTHGARTTPLTPPAPRAPVAPDQPAAVRVPPPVVPAADPPRPPSTVRRTPRPRRPRAAAPLAPRSLPHERDAKDVAVEDSDRGD